MLPFLPHARRRALPALALLISFLGCVASPAPAFAANTAPTISGTPSTRALVGQPYGFRPTAADADGDRLSFSITNRPAWATFSTSTGQLSGTPTTTGTSPYIQIRAYDGQAITALPLFTITTSASNRAPSISGAPVTNATAGSPYAFRPVATDADGDRLRFSIVNQPGWATFDSNTGSLYGTPASTNVGTFGGIVVSVSDGLASAALASFSIAVAASPAGNASVTLRWSPPTKNVDGTPVTGLTGYRVSYGTGPGTYSTSLSIGGASVTSAVIQGLATGQRYYFAVKAVNTSGALSDFSNEVSKAL